MGALKPVPKTLKIVSDMEIAAKNAKEREEKEKKLGAPSLGGKGFFKKKKENRETFFQLRKDGPLKSLKPAAGKLKD